VPEGYRLQGYEAAPGSNTLITLNFAAATGRSFQISQRQGWLPLDEELEVARVPFTPLGPSRRRLYVVHGLYGGEPIDHTFWAATRRSVAVEIDGLVVEVREITGTGPGLRNLLHIAAGMDRGNARHGAADTLEGEPSGRRGRLVGASRKARSSDKLNRETKA
jgi:hypothetical protein